MLIQLQILLIIRNKKHNHTSLLKINKYLLFFSVSRQKDTLHFLIFLYVVISIRNIFHNWAICLINYLALDLIYKVNCFLSYSLNVIVHKVTLTFFEVLQTFTNQTIK
jgi:hypothetical protein